MYDCFNQHPESFGKLKHNQVEKLQTQSLYPLYDAFSKIKVLPITELNMCWLPGDKEY